MKLRQIPKDEIEFMSYDDVALVVLQEGNRKMKLRDIFAKVCKFKGLSDEVVDEQLVDFFELMSTNKRFIMLENGYWDLQSRHKLDENILDDDEDEEIIDNDDLDEEIVEEDEDIYYDNEDEVDDIGDDDLKDLVIIDSDEEM